MTSLHKRICKILYPILLETAAKQREIHNKPESTSKMVRSRQILDDSFARQDWSEKFADKMRVILLELTEDKIFEAPLGVRTKKGFAPFTVLLGTFDKTENSLAICLHEKGMYLKLNGTENNFTIDTKKIASDEQIKQYLEELNPLQLRFIMSSPVFMPLVNSLYEEAEPEQTSEPVVEQPSVG